MNKSAKGIIGLSAALVVLGGGLAVLTLTEKDGTGTESSSSDTIEATTDAYGSGLTLIYDDTLQEPDSEELVRGTVKTVDVENSEDSFTVKFVSAATETSTAKYTIEGCEDLPLVDTSVSSVVNSATLLTSTAIIEENSENTSRFGFDDPQATVRVTYESGTVKTLVIGAAAPANSQTYVMLDGSSTVYTVSTSSLSNYMKKTSDFVNKVLLEDPADGVYPIVLELDVERRDKDRLVLEYDTRNDDDDYMSGSTATHIMTEPTFSYLAVERSTKITHGMYGLTAESIYAIHCTESDIQSAGLDDPYCRVTMACDDGNTYVLLLSELYDDEDNNKLTYAMFEGGNVIYVLSSENAPWITLNPIDVTSRNNIFSTYVWQIETFSVKLATGETADFVIIPKNSDVDRTNGSSGEFNTTLNGNEFDTERYRTFYAFLISNATAEDFAPSGSVNGDLLATVEFTDSYTNSNTTINFYDYSLMTVIADVNGESRFICSKTFIDELTKNIALLETDEEFVGTVK